ncbi:MAG: hypothetical protein GC206_05110 [Alphaproteobacteria bacterium]|nr:hypothetical protein [Alphaproteobacteria bacterium]
MLRTRLAGVLFLASLPGVVLGGMEAHRAYISSQQIAQEALTRTARQVVSRVEEVVNGSVILADSLTQSAAVRAPAPACADILANAADQSERFAFIDRLNIRGDVICSSDPTRVGAGAADRDWIEQAVAANRSTISTVLPTPDGARIVAVSAPILQRDRTIGLVIAGLRGDWLIARVAENTDGEDNSIVVMDADGAPLASASRGAPEADVLEAARSAARGESFDARRYQTGLASSPGGGLSVAIVAPTRSAAFGLRAALIGLAPLIAVALAMAAVWIVFNGWVIRWVDRLVESARTASAGQYEAAPLEGAPAELQVLGAAFDDAVMRANARAEELTHSLSRNRELARELHHRVKNNIQVFTSALSRQLRRAREPTARYALSEARARLLPIALTYRFSAAPEDITRVDLSGYLDELARQIHNTLDGDTRGVELDVECDSTVVAIDAATAIGMIVTECLICAYFSSVGMSKPELMLRFKADAEGGGRLESGVRRLNPSHDSARLDEALVQQLAHQIEAQLQIELGPRVVLTWARLAAMAAIEPPRENGAGAAAPTPG